MHNLGNQFFQGEMANGDNQEYGYELSPEFELGNEYSQEYNNGYNQEYADTEFELSPEFESDYNRYEYPQYEMEETELVQELMDVSNEAEFFNWLKKTAKKAAGVASNFLSSPTGQKAASALTNIAKKTLPKLAAAAGKLGGGRFSPLVNKASNMAADRFPAFVRFATNTLRNLANEVNVGNTPAVKPAIVKAAVRHYPIILKVKGTLSARPVKGGMPGEFEYENGYNTEYEYDNESEFENDYEEEFEGEIDHQEGTFNEVTEMELASEMLSLNSEAELDHFLGKLFKKAAGAVKKFAKGPLGKMLKGIAKKVLPMAGGALGSFIPGAGTALGASLGTAASNLFELELEGLSPEDREFETARAFVRFAGNAARRASRMRNRNPHQSARTALIHAARRYAPGLIVGRGTTYNTNYYGGNNPDEGGNDLTSGSWYREGNKIILYGGTRGS